MNNEIKEMIDKIKKCLIAGYDIDIISQEEMGILWNYITNLQEENEELKMTNLALADDITKNKIIKQEVLTECCGIPIGEIPMLKIKNDDYKQRINKAIKYIRQTYCFDKTDWHDQFSIENYDKLLNILKGD